ncbi:MAG: hypothetical protein JWM11_5313 [Planctomycetaceae bacterium]|nr:hypothetical protein [Planctomycetaceae bacterium]
MLASSTLSDDYQTSRVPTTDGQAVSYREGALATDSPRIYYVNGIRTSGIEHSLIALALSRVTERIVIGVFNRSNGAVIDLAQSLGDWIVSGQFQRAEFCGRDRLTSELCKVVEQQSKVLALDPIRIVRQFREHLPEAELNRFIELYIGVLNPATVTLFRELQAHRHQRQIIIAHSQGNLVTCNALAALDLVFGETALSQIRVLSLASPVAAWPSAIRPQRKDYGFYNDLVTFADPESWWWFARRLVGNQQRRAGDWRSWGDGSLGIDMHGIDKHLECLAVANDLRRTLSLPNLEAGRSHFGVNPAICPKPAR